MSLPPLDESFAIQNNDEPYEQWYYANDGSFSPNRKVDSLVLTPVMKVTDPDSRVVTQVSPTSLSGWYVMNSDGTWPDSPITNQQDGSNVDYIFNPVNCSLTVKKNVLPDMPVVLKVRFVYADPRAAGVLYTKEDTLTLNTNQDTETVFPDLYVDAPPVQTFDPIHDTLVNGHVRDHFSAYDYEFNATAKWNTADITPDVSFVWKVKDVDGGLEEDLAEIFPGYVSGQGTTQLRVNAMFSENFAVVCCARFRYTPVKNPTGNPATLGYYTRTVTTITNPTGNPKTSGWYVLNGKFLVPTQDTTPQQGITYYSVAYAATTDTTPQAGVVYYTTNGDLFPDKIYRTVSWKIPDLYVYATCGGGNVVEATDGEKAFDTAVNSEGNTLSEEVRNAHFLFNWKRRQTNLNTVHDEGWGPNLVLPNSKLFVPTKFTVNVKPEPYVLGALRQVTCDGQPVTLDGVPVFSRT